MDFMKALQYPFEDPDWLKKLGIAVALILLNLVPLIGSLAYIMLLQGWGYQTTKNVKGNVPNPLAGWDDFGGLLGKGAVLFGANLVYQIPVAIVLCIAYSPLIIATMVGDSDTAQTLAGLGGIMILCGWCLTVLYSIAAGVVYWGGYIRFLDRSEFGTFMQFSDNFAIVRNNIGDFAMALVYILGAGVIGSIASSITFGIGGLLVGTFLAYFSSHILGQLAAKIGGGMAQPAM